MKIKHYSIFKNNNTLDWEMLRNSEDEKSYFLPFTKEEYLSKVDVDSPSMLSKQILQEIENTKLNKIFSIGSGIASLEFQLKKFSNHSVIVSDNNSSILRLKQYGIFDDAIILDAFRDTWPVDGRYIVLFPRIDTEFNDIELGKLFATCHSAGIIHICFIPAELLSLRIIIAEIKILILSLIKRKPRVFCGYARSIKSFKKIWEPYFEISTRIKADKQIFFLRAKQQSV